MIRDSTNGSFKANSNPLPTTYLIPAGDGIVPVVTDSLVFISDNYRVMVYDAYTAQYVISLPGDEGGESGVTIAGDMVYYTTDLSAVNRPDGSTYYAGFVNCYDLKAKVIRWKKELKDIDFYLGAPCVLTKSHTAYRGTASNK
jgi:hypothetical protein